DREVGAFRTDRVDLALDLLCQEIELLADRVRRARQELAELVQMRVQTGDLFRNVRALREDDGLLLEPARIERDVGEEDRESLFQRRVQPREDVAAGVGDPAETLPEKPEPLLEVRGEEPALRLPH